MDKHKEAKKQIRWLVVILIYSFCLYFFYIRYVPLISGFQIALIFFLSIVTILNIKNTKWGLLFFVFCFPLINNLPYLFNISEPLPHAPTALVLFLFFFLGWLIHYGLSFKILTFPSPLAKPIILFSLLLLVSGIITFLRYANFFPFLSDHIYELITNTHGVASGGAFMSIVFNALNYLSGFIFFYIVIMEIQTPDLIRKVLFALCASTFFSLLFGLFQHLIDAKMGNNPTSIYLGMINATFKDAISFGSYLAITAPIMLAVCCYYKGILRIISFIVLVLSIYMIFFSGSKIGFLSLFFSLLLFLSIAVITALRLPNRSLFSFKKMHWSSIAIMFLIAVIILGVISYNHILAPKMTQSLSILRIKGIIKSFNLGQILQERYDLLWKMALYMVKDYPLTGVGIGAYIIELSNYATLHHSPVDIPQSAENYWLQVGSELGVVGLLLVLWIFWEIMKEIKRIYKKIPMSDKRKFIFFGAVAGIISYLTIIQFHTFIGSYEIGYAFWLLVGLAFCLGRMPAEDRAENEIGEKSIPAHKLCWSKILKLSSIFVIILYSGIHFWNSTHSLSLQSRTRLLGIKQDFGFYQPEKTSDGREFRWTKKCAGLTTLIEKPALQITLLASHPDIQRNPVQVKIYLVKNFFKQEILLDDLTLTRNVWQTHEYYIPQKIGQEVILLFKVSRTWQPLKALGIPDPRKLGIALGSIQYEVSPSVAK